MKDDGDSGGDGGGGENPVTVVVGVKFGGRSRELLTWALVKVANSGDRVIALHVVDSVPENSASLLSVVKSFEAMLRVYEGFCNLKQVELKLKVCRGASVRRVLATEANSCGAATFILGTSKSRHCLRSSASVAKYCATKLPKKLSVLAVDNGRIVFQREGDSLEVDGLEHGDGLYKKQLGIDRHVSSKKMQKGTEATKKSCRESTNNNPRRSLDGRKCQSVEDSGMLDNSVAQLPEETVDNSLALVPIQTHEEDTSPTSSLTIYTPKKKSRWPFLRRVFIPPPETLVRSSCRKMSVIRWALRFKGRQQSAAIIYPDGRQINSCNDKDGSSTLDGQSGAIVSFGSEISWSSLSLCNGFDNFAEELESLHKRYSSTCRVFSYQELLSATSGFAPENMVGKGGSGYVYRGCLPQGKELAVKILKPSVDVVKEFVVEIDIITGLHHNNIVSLFGFCSENENLLLVYNFLPRGSLEENLHGNKKDTSAFGWSERYKAALGVAEALNYLHNGRELPVIHRDVKSSNILLSDDFEAQLSDFGLANWDVNSSSSQRICTDVAGTFGYLAPEYFMHGRVSEKVDVYAFGVVLLELLSGRKPIDSGNNNCQESLVLWILIIFRRSQS
ncbi:PREDICTED: probable L-type lectin-domain containing receptor kinase II.1 isoform X2 [Tarenaya hassleriana]|uniref:probable L-type lectin-domain containing receptor kinase II.1 isoform X2 n=1 Tax=Tarenaya hassleriana TaxID=28532 RepID=UPI0008FD67D1|nr:PREDICTED: probable L-type lectin-domain containing receptor kinase II.1 isoform X2 [Tarenaya hassleriana]